MAFITAKQPPVQCVKLTVLFNVLCAGIFIFKRTVMTLL